MVEQIAKIYIGVQKESGTILGVNHWNKLCGTDRGGVCTVRGGENIICRGQV